MKTPLHVILRRKSRNLLNSFLSFVLGGKKTSQESIDISKVQRVAIVRPNYRIGNLIFLTPLINEIGLHNPNIKIDLIVGMKSADKIFSNMPNIDKIIDIPRKLLASPIALYKFIKEARKRRYDVTINVISGSVSSQIVTLLINSKYKLGYKNEKSWMPLSHVVESKGIYQHSGLNTLELLRAFDIDRYLHKKELDIKLTQEEIEKASLALESLLEKENIKREERYIIALFRNARYEKKLSDKWWNTFLQTLMAQHKDITVIDILSPDIPNKLNDTVLEYSNKNLRDLAAFFRACDLYISADTGPLHLALASQTRVIALFNKTNPKTYGTLGEKNKTIDFNNLTPSEVAEQIGENL